VKQKIYVASSWRNQHQPRVVKELRSHGHDVYDFKNPAEGDHGFSWKQCDPRLPDSNWTLRQLAQVLDHPIARRGFGLDYGGMAPATAACLVLPSGRSAHLEAGWLMAKLPRRVCIYCPHAFIEPELMYLLNNLGDGPAGDFMFDDMNDVIAFFDRLPEMLEPLP